MPSRNPKFYVRKGAAHVGMPGQKEDARKAYLEALRLSPGYLAAEQGLAALDELHVGN